MIIFSSWRFFFENLKMLPFCPEKVSLKGFPYKPTISDGWFIRKSFKERICIDFLSFFLRKKKTDIVFCDISGSTDPFELKFHRDTRKNISFRFLTVFGIFEPPVFVQTAKCAFFKGYSVFSQREETIIRSTISLCFSSKNIKTHKNQ